MTAAAELSPTTTQSQAEELAIYIARLSGDEKENFLMRLLQGEAHLDIALTNRLRQFIQPSDKDIHNPEGRSIRELSGIAQKINQLRLEQERHKREIEKAKHLKTIAQKEGQLWTEVLHLIGEKKTSAYDQAIAILKDLRNLAEYEKRLSEFQKKMRAIQDQYPTLWGLHGRLKDAGLI